MRDKLVRADVLIARIAARQHGVVTTAQLNAAGLDRDAIRRRVAAGRLHPIYRGVYAVGHTGLSSRGRWMAAALACGDGAVISHRTAAELWGMLKSTTGPIHVTVPVAGGRAKRNGLCIHRHPSLPRTSTTSRDRIPVTSPQRTLEDLRRAIEPGELRLAVRQAELLGLPIEAATIVPDRAASHLELEFLKLCRRHRLPPPQVNVRIGPYTVDFLWREQRLVVETDGHRYHRGAVATEDDLQRDRHLRKLGYEVVRLTYWQVMNARREVATRIRAALRRETRAMRD